MSNASERPPSVVLSDSEALSAMRMRRVSASRGRIQASGFQTGCKRRAGNADDARGGASARGDDERCGCDQARWARERGECQRDV